MFQFLSADAGQTANVGGMSTTMMLIWIVVMVALFYFVGIRPQKKQQKKHEELMASVAIGDSVLTTSTQSSPTSP